VKPLSDELGRGVVVAECQCVVDVTVSDKVDALFSSLSSSGAGSTHSKVVDTSDEPLVVGRAG